MLGRFKGLAKLFSNRPYFATPSFKFSSTEGDSTAETELENQNEETEKENAVKRTNKLRKAAVVLSGSGVYDGSEITEAVSFLIALSARRITFQCYAPNKDQSEVVNHLTGESTGEKRNVLVESARIARGKVKDIKELQAADYDAVFFPGGFGAAKNLSTFATQGAEMTVDPEVERVLREFHQNRRAIGLTCIAPILAAKVFGGEDQKKKVGLTLGGKGDKWPYQESIDVAEKLGAKHFTRPVSKSYIDAANLVFTTPAFMRDTSDFSEIYQGIDSFVTDVENHLKSQKAVEAEKKRKEKEKKREAKERKAAKKAAKKAEKLAAKQGSETGGGSANQTASIEDSAEK